MPNLYEGSIFLKWFLASFGLSGVMEQIIVAVRSMCVSQVAGSLKNWRVTGILAYIVDVCARSELSAQ